MKKVLITGGGGYTGCHLTSFLLSRNFKVIVFDTFWFGNYLKKHKNYELLIINEGELRHELRNNSEDIKKLIKLISNELKIKNAIVTQGSSGSTYFSKKNNKFYTSPAFASKVIDKIDAGDALLAISSLCLIKNLDKNLLLLIGSLAASQIVESIGNSKNVNKKEILKSVNYILK